MSNDLAVIAPDWVLSYMPFSSFPVVYAWFALVNRRWLAPISLSFGLPFAVMSFVVFLTGLLRTVFTPWIEANRVIVSVLSLVIWGGSLWVQTFIRREYQAADEPAQWIFLVGWTNFLGLSTYLLLIEMAYTVGLR